MFLISFLLSCATTSRSFSNKVSAVSFKSLTKASITFSQCHLLFSWKLCCKHLHNPQTLVFDLARKVPTKLKHYVICKSVVPFQPVSVNVNFEPVSVCQGVNVVTLVFCHLHVSYSQTFVYHC